MKYISNINTTTTNINLQGTYFCSFIIFNFDLMDLLKKGAFHPDYF